MDFRILGPVEVHRDDGSTVALGGPRQRAVFTILVLRANEVVSTDRLIDELWGDRPPRAAIKTVQMSVSRLRRLLGANDRCLVTRPPGYVLEAAAGEIDADRAADLHTRGRGALAAGDAQRAATLFGAAEELWRGPSLADFTYEPFAQATIARLEGLRVRCREDRIEAQLALGRHDDVVPELEALVRERPFRERPCGQLMLALYRAGRQGEALDTYRQAREALQDELGVEPGEDLRRLEGAILRQEPALRAPPPPPVARSSVTARKVVTVLAGAVSARPPVGRADVELVRRLSREARGQATRVVSRHGGVCHDVLGADIVGVFGLPLAHEDDALRALRAADELRAAPAEWALRLGVDTREVVTGGPDDPALGELAGEAVALARSAGDGGVMVSDATRRLTRAAARLEPAPGDAWTLKEILPGAPAIERRLDMPMVGREGELAAACGAFERAADERTTRMLTVIGEAGLGKSRLAQELCERLSGQATILTGHCRSYGEGVALRPLREAFRRVLESESRGGIRELLDDSPDADLVADVVAGAVGLDAPPSGGEQIPWAFRRTFESLARRRPVLLVIEDAHWAQSPLLDLVEDLVEWLTAAPLQILCLARPELLDARPHWGGGRPNVESLSLTRLGDDDARRMLNNLLGDVALGPAECQRIVSTAEGNPLFVEQLLAHYADDRSWTHDDEIPATIQALLAARLDRLGPGERSVLERAAVIGREFTLRAVAELLPAEAAPAAGEHLRTLVRRGLLRASATGPDGEPRLRFDHILIRGVAYRSTAKALRGELHERCADALAGRGTDQDEIVGFHLEQAFLCREIERLDDEMLALAARAGERLAAAGRRALASGDANAGAKLLGRARDLFEAGGGGRPDVLLDLGTALSESGQFGAAEDVLQAALEQAAQDDVLAARVRIELSYRRLLVDPSIGVRDLLETAERAIAVFDRAGDDVGRSRAWIHVAQAHWTQCRCAEMEAVLERALRYADRAGDRRDRSLILRDLARATVIGPRPVDDGVRRCHRILERASDDVAVTAIAEAMLAVLEAMRGDFETARTHWSVSRDRLERAGLGPTLAGLQMYAAFVELIAGRPEAAEGPLREGYGVLERIGERGRLTTTAALLARALWAQGRYDESAEYNRVAREAAGEDDVVSHVLWRTNRARALAHSGESRDADALTRTAVGLADQTDFLMLRAYAFADRADVLTALGRPDEAELDAAIAIYERKGMSGSAEALRLRLPAAATGTT